MSRSHRLQWNYTRSAHTLTRHLDSRCIVEPILRLHEARRIVKNQQKMCVLSGILFIFFYFISTECCVMAVQAVIRCIARSYYAFVFIACLFSPNFLSLSLVFSLFTLSFSSPRRPFPLHAVFCPSHIAFCFLFHRITSAKHAHAFDRKDDLCQRCLGRISFETINKNVDNRAIGMRWRGHVAC